jgi:PilZ domain-containing protein
MAEDKRHSKRRMIIVEVRYEGGGLRGQTRIADMSETGVYVDVMTPLPIGVPLQLEFRLPGGHEIRAEGIVVRSEPRIGMAIRFTQIALEDQQQIAETIARQDR